jgi:hypothetical protein
MSEKKLMVDSRVFGKKTAFIFELTEVGIPTTDPMPATALRKRNHPAVIEDYDVAADAKRRISLRHAKTKYFHVKAFSNGAYFLEPRVLVPPHMISARTMKMIEQSAANLKKGRASAPIDFDKLPKI